MTDYVTLIGAEDVLRAGRMIDGAADSIVSAAGSIDSTAHGFFQRLDERLDRFEHLVARIEATRAITIVEIELVEPAPKKPWLFVCWPRRTGVTGMYEWQIGRLYGSWLWHERRVKNFVVRWDKTESP